VANEIAGIAIIIHDEKMGDILWSTGLHVPGSLHASPPIMTHCFQASRSEMSSYILDSCGKNSGKHRVLLLRSTTTRRIQVLHYAA
jgi:hypothetical protein